MHELMHPLFNHYIHSAGALTNIACDAVIFGDGDEECEALAPFGPVMKLEDVVDACGSG